MCSHRSDYCTRFAEESAHRLFFVRSRMWLHHREAVRPHPEEMYDVSWNIKSFMIEVYVPQAQW